MDHQTAVSIICNTYNHEKYIKDALESFLMQKTNFKFEVLIHDDASTDKTADIIREYEKKFPDIIKPIYQTSNQYSQNILISRTFQIPRAKGKYIAYCEGDDYWCDEYKLQKQFDAMEKHPECDICTHNALVIDAATGNEICHFSPGKTNKIITVGKVILGGGQFVATNSIFCRSQMNQHIPRFRDKWEIDYTIQIHGSLRGGMLYLKDCMSVYRSMVENSWNERNRNDINHYMQNLKNQEKMYDYLNEDTNFLYSSYIKKKKAIDRISPLFSKRKFNDIFSKENIVYYKALPVKYKFKIRFSKISPVLLNKLLIIKRKFLN